MFDGVMDLDCRNCLRKEMIKVPWYNNPVLTCKVLNRIANRYTRATLQDLNTVLDRATQLIWNKQEQYFRNYKK